MNVQQAPEWLPSYLIPFFTLSYPTAPPAAPDSFPNASYYKNGLLDGCLIITFIAVMAVLRDVARLWILEPFCSWKLTRDLRLSLQAKRAAANGNGKANGATNGVGKVNGVANGMGKANGVANRIGEANGHIVVNGKANGVANGNGHAVYANENGHTVYVSGVVISRKQAKKIHRSVLRFAEQGWPVIYYSCLWSLGVYVHSNLPTKILNPIDVWTSYPHIPLAAPLKFYYLLQTAFYCHQILILNAEARRKDHWQMMTHHIITVALMVASYFFNFTRVGCLILMITDWCDIFLPLAKMFRYLSLSTLCDVTFVWFMISWAVTRHALFILVIISTYTAMNTIPPRLDVEHGFYTTREIFSGFLVLLSMLQVIQIMWFWMICRVAWRVVSGQGAEDSRSDDEDGDDLDEETKKDR
ncbi:longevity assurance proteins LAG1/LAC1 [Laetiporus sulphureus 93-53]|uniref:Longevity assurance proteins LAG1/LAC1 n=1 Tax=Laetiporus sulphureus 93-53 TaxID=1314785 RepID=A0A165IHB2_9APHY|nr:longevity assurance proteins LAG1/LAC1 [Laetiporus sulphureus 93-53]KZT13072.1 longevity assurance proteins LAG1/LAC1 [Laetiporus sulphureus 93-53]